ncbi:methionyl-tRNA formyltransferase [uncultured Cohaesibacter sp.]|uniref:methionyl-tRNA formyltransferase n=1 Tax=uncultured Cohaesibacter sp. TaxID=1002546 RepID=UPI002931BAA4|nr:methionyl-tRNA formyltransferase [uncultured Cohaesibacter sp.]
MSKIVIASSKDWFEKAEKSAEFDQLDVHWIHNKHDLTIERLEDLQPRYIFFPHWNWIIPEEIYQPYECIVFHTAPLPYGRGGSPIQNLILRGFTSSPVCALRVTGILDGGPIYDRREVSLDGTIEAIFSRIATCVEDLIVSICRDEPLPEPQSGDIVEFSRRVPADSALSQDLSRSDLYDRIRMVDGAGYPKAFIQFGDYRLELSEADFSQGTLSAKVTFHATDD